MSDLEDRQKPQRPSWYLLDGAALAKANPYTFYKPSDQAVALLRPVNQVILIIALKYAEPDKPLLGQQVPVRIDRIESEQFFGTLEQTPALIGDLKIGSSIAFEPRHIVDVDIDDPVPDPTLPYKARCIVTKTVLDGQQGVGFLARGEPIDSTDSGWRISALDEPRDWTREEHFAFVSLGEVLQRDDSFLAVLPTPVPCAFQRDPETGLFVPVSASEEELRPSARLRLRTLPPDSNLN